MKKFDDFLEKLFENPSDKTSLLVKGKSKSIKGMAKYSSVNSGSDYIKISFDDDSLLIIIPNEEELSFSVVYKGKKYELVVGDDYQFCLRLFVGKPNKDIEGEVKFSDYVCEDDEDEMLSLGWIVYSGERADVLARSIGIEDVEIL
jgi:hypothetical protein